jgi:hypothetical protein
MSTTTKDKIIIVTCLGVVAGLVFADKIFTKKEVAKSSDFSSANGQSKSDSTPPPDVKDTQKWVYTVENNKDYCRWYDKYGRNTRTYNAPCSKSQANMYGNAKK